MKSKQILVIFLFLVFACTLVSAQSDTKNNTAIKLNFGVSTPFGLPAKSSPIIPDIGVDFNFGDFGIRAAGQFFKSSLEFDIANYLAPINSFVTQTGEAKHSNLGFGISPYLNLPMEGFTLQPSLGINYLSQTGADLMATYGNLAPGAILDATGSNNKRSAVMISPNIRAILGSPDKQLRFFAQASYNMAVGIKEFKVNRRNLDGVILPDGSIDPDLMELGTTISSIEKMMPPSFYIGIGLELNLSGSLTSGNHKGRNNRLPNDCKCWRWDDPQIIISSSNLPHDIHGDCNDSITLPNPGTYNISPTYICYPDSLCVATYQWAIYGSSGLIDNGNSHSIVDFNFPSQGIYTVVLKPKCGSEECPPCKFQIIIENDCQCGDWLPLTVLGATNVNYQCGYPIQWTCNQALNFTASYQCNPNDSTCQATTSWEVRKGTVINSGTGNNTLNGSFTPTQNGVYEIILTAWCNGVECRRCHYKVIVSDCCQASEIIIKKGAITIPNDSSCIESGSYSFNLNITPSSPSVSGTFILTSMPSGATLNTGTFTSGIPLNLSIPQYVCGSVTGFKLTYTWNHGRCSETIERTICPSCCENINLIFNDYNLNGTDLYFIAKFSVSHPLTFSKVKVQILEITYNGVAIPYANIVAFEENSVPWSLGNKDHAITTPGNAIWFPGPVAPVPIVPGELNFKGIIINMLGTNINRIKLLLRFTFYQTNAPCDEVICEKDIIYPSI